MLLISQADLGNALAIADTLGEATQRAGDALGERTRWARV